MRRIMEAWTTPLDKTVLPYWMNKTIDSFQDVIIQDDQKILGIGLSFDDNYYSSVYVIRFMPDGSVDSEFGVNGIFRYELDFEALAYSGVINSDGKIILVGSTTNYIDYRMLLIQLNSDGTLDSSFGEDGVVTASIGLADEFQSDQASAIALDSNENILICGFSLDENSSARPVVLRFSQDGVLDTTFGESGVATIPISNAENTFDCVAVQPDGKIIAAGHYANDILWYVALVVRFNVDGTLDTTFGNEGIVKYSYSDVDDEVYDMVIAPDGKIILAGFSGSQDYNYNTLLMRLTSDGVLDSTFGVDGIVAEDNGSFDIAEDVTLLEDGRILIAGTSGEAPPGMSNMAAWIYQSDGSPDMSFGDNGFSTHMISGTSVIMHGMDVQVDGKIVIAGQSRPGNGANDFIVIRLLNSVVSGIKDSELAVSPKVFPNPATSNQVISLEIAPNTAQFTSISYYTLDGRLIQSVPLSVNSSTTQVTTNIPSGLAKGLYLIRFEGNGIISSGSKLIIQ